MPSSSSLALLDKSNRKAMQLAANFAIKLVKSRLIIDIFLAKKLRQ
jgi:hypothetical protein